MWCWMQQACTVPCFCPQHFVSAPCQILHCHKEQAKFHEWVLDKQGWVRADIRELSTVTKVKTDRTLLENPYHSRPRPEPNPEIEGNFWCYCLVTKSCPTLCNPMDCSMAGFPVLHYLLEFAQIPVHWFSDSIQPSHPLLPLSPFPLIFPSNGVFSNELALLIKWTKYWSFSISPSNDYSGLISFRI